MGRERIIVEAKLGGNPLNNYMLAGHISISLSKDMHILSVHKTLLMLHEIRQVVFHFEVHIITTKQKKSAEGFIKYLKHGT